MLGLPSRVSPTEAVLAVAQEAWLAGEYAAEEKINAWDEMKQTAARPGDPRWDGSTQRRPLR